MLAAQTGLLGSITFLRQADSRPDHICPPCDSLVFEMQDTESACFYRILQAEDATHCQSEKTVGEAS
jgi:hypothetical protein